MRRLKGMTDEYRDLGVLNFEMEAATLFKMGLVYGFAAGCVCAIIAQRTSARSPTCSPQGRRRRRRPSGVAVGAADRWTAKPAAVPRQPDLRCRPGLPRRT